MHKDIIPALKFATSLLHVEKELIKLLRTTKQQSGGGITRIGYVAGILTSDGVDNFENNRKRIIAYADKLRKIHKFPIFCTVDVFSDDVYGKLEEQNLEFEEREIKFRIFWKKIFIHKIYFFQGFVKITNYLKFEIQKIQIMKIKVINLIRIK